jgi:hypothetical protein
MKKLWFSVLFLGSQLIYASSQTLNFKVRDIACCAGVALVASGIELQKKSDDHAQQAYPMLGKTLIGTGTVIFLASVMKYNHVEPKSNTAVIENNNSTSTEVVDGNFSLNHQPQTQQSKKKRQPVAKIKYKPATADEYLQLLQDYRS